MGVTVVHEVEGTGAQPRPEQWVTIQYTGFLKDEKQAKNQGKK